MNENKSVKPSMNIDLGSIVGRADLFSYYEINLNK